MGDLVKQWGPYLLGMLVSLGVFEWLRNKIKETKLVKNAMIEGLLDRVLLRAVEYVEARCKKEDDKTPGEEKRARAVSMAKSFLSSKGVKTPPDAELGIRADEAWARMEAAKDFPVAAS